MPEDLRSTWSSLSPREKDARVAEALGHTLWRVLNPVTLDAWQEERSPEWRRVFPTDWPTKQLPWSEFDPRMLSEADDLMPYSTSWEHAGPLLDRLAADGFFPELYAYQRDSQAEFRVAYCVRWVQHSRRLARGVTHDTEAPQPSAPEAISLAFVLSRESREKTQGGGA